MKDIPLKYLKAFLDTQTKETLANLVIDLFRRSSEARNFFSLLVNPENSDRQLVEETKKIIKREFFPERGFGRLSLATARKAIFDYKKLPHSTDGLADLMAYYVEMGVDFTKAYGDISEPFYNSMGSMYNNFLKYITEHGLEDQFRDRAIAIVSRTSGIGWGFHDELSELYDTYIEE